MPVDNPAALPVIPRKKRMKALVRRLLDRIDELDETDPFGRSYHHDGPYEAIASGESTQGHLFAHGETGLSLHLQPGQILQHNTTYRSLASRMAIPQCPLQPEPVPTRPCHSRHQSLPTHSPSRVGIQKRHSSPLQARHPAQYTPNISNSPPLYHDNNAPPYVLHQTEKTVFPPPRYQSTPECFHPSSPRSPQHTPSPTMSTETAVPCHDSLHGSAHSSVSSYTINSIITHSSSSVQTEPLDLQRMRHLPKRLVMPAPLQPQPQYKSPPASPPAWQDVCPDDTPSETAHFQKRPDQEPRRLRKRSSAFPAKRPIPDHAPTSQDDALPIIEHSQVKTASEAKGATQRTRRKLSKRKNDI